MRDLKDAKNIYDHIVVPEELDARLRATLENIPETKKNVSIVPLVRWTATAAAALFLCFTVGLNTSESFAMEAAELPIIGQIAKVLTIRSYETKEDTTPKIYFIISEKMTKERILIMIEKLLKIYFELDD